MQPAVAIRTRVARSLRTHCPPARRARAPYPRAPLVSRRSTIRAAATFPVITGGFPSARYHYIGVTLPSKQTSAARSGRNSSASGSVRPPTPCRGSVERLAEVIVGMAEVLGGPATASSARRARTADRVCTRPPEGLAHRNSEVITQVRRCQPEPDISRL